MRIVLQTIVCVWSLAAFCQAAPVRVAVLEIDSPQLGNLATLLESELLKLPDVESLERAGLQNILQEQKLQAALTAGANAERMRLAKLLKADVLVILQAQEKPKPHARLVIFEARQGLRLQLEPFSPSKVTDDVQKLLPSVKMALARYREPRREIVAIPSFLDASLSTDNQHLGSTIARLVEQNLLRRPEVLVVEIEEAHSVAREATLSGENIATRTLPLYLIGEYRFAARVENRTVSYSLEIKRGTQVLDKLKNDGVTADQFIASIQADALKLLDTALGKTAPAVDVEAENRQLISRSLEMQAVGDLKSSLELVEAALAIKPDQYIEQGRAAQLITKLARDTPTSPADLNARRNSSQAAERGLAMTKLRRRALPHLELFWIGDNRDTHHKGYGDPAYIDFFTHPTTAEWKRENDAAMREYREMVGRILEYKANNRVNDETLFSLRKSLTDPPGRINLEQELLEILDPVELQKELDIDYDLAKQFSYLRLNNNVPYTGARWTELMAPKFYYSTKKPELQRDNLAKLYLTFLDQVLALDAPALRIAAEKHRREMLQKMDPAQEVAVAKPTPPTVTGRDPKDVDVVRREIKLVELTNGMRKPFFSSPPTAWLAVKPGLDIINFSGVYYWLRDQGELQQVKAPELAKLNRSDALHAQMSSDGRYVWILVPGKTQLLVVIDPQSDASWSLNAEQGLPALSSFTFGASICAYTEGQACVAGNFERKRRWIARADFDPAQGIKLDVFHEANQQALPQADVRSDPLTYAGVVLPMHSIRGRQQPDGPLEYRLLMSTGTMLLIDPAGRTVKNTSEYVEDKGDVKSKMLFRVVQCNEGHFVVLAYVKNSKGSATGLMRYGFPDFEYELPKKNNQQLAHGELYQHQGDVYLDYNKKVQFSATVTGQFREVREAQQNVTETRKFFQTGHYGLVFYVGNKLYTWDRVKPDK